MGRVPLTLLIMMIDPPSPVCMTALAACDDVQRRGEVQLDDLGVEPGRRRGGVGRRRTAGVVDYHVEPSVTGRRPPVDQPPGLVGVTHVGRDEVDSRPAATGSSATVRPQTSTRAPAARNAEAMPAPIPRCRR